MLGKVLVVLAGISLTASMSGAEVDPLCAKYGSEHTTCFPAKNCATDANGGPCGVTEDEKVFIVKYHNEYRQKVAKGQETRGSPGPQPAGKNIRELSWNDDLARTAQRWAEQFVLGHDCKKCNIVPDYSVGQNLYLEANSATIEKANWQKAIDSWTNEAEKMDGSNLKGNWKVVGHYTQVVWHNTRHVGCGAFGNNEKCSWVNKTNPSWGLLNCVKYICNYGPSGNMLDKNHELPPPYSTTEGCVKPSTNYPGLCAE
ncbi:venom allergen 5 [Hyalella azteca]|uniref:Venom allergen 5 n=1 Tax=Hyalella azteca TaxID=294128 RepID=A0A8B7NLU2_HYAAZ|nr:venom allergen 5 [Hyalella azteca]